MRWKGMGRVVGRKRTSVRWRMGSAGWEENGCEGDGKGRAARDGRKTDKCEMDRCDVFRGVTKKPRARRQAAVLLLRSGPQYG